MLCDAASVAAVGFYEPWPRCGSAHIVGLSESETPHESGGIEVKKSPVHSHIVAWHAHPQRCVAFELVDVAAGIAYHHAYYGIAGIFRFCVCGVKGASHKRNKYFFVMLWCKGTKGHKVLCDAVSVFSFYSYWCLSEINNQSVVDVRGFKIIDELVFVG